VAPDGMERKEGGTLRKTAQGQRQSRAAGGREQKTMEGNKKKQRPPGERKREKSKVEELKGEETTKGGDGPKWEREIQKRSNFQGRGRPLKERKARNQKGTERREK